MAFIFGKCQLFIPEMCIGVLTTFIQACSLNRKRKAHKITCLYPLEIPDLKPPDAFGILIVSTPPYLRNSSSKNPPLPSEFQKAVRRTVRIFSGIAQYCKPLIVIIIIIVVIITVIIKQVPCKQKKLTLFFCFLFQLRSQTFRWFEMKDPKDEAQSYRKRDDLSKEIVAWRVKLRRERLLRLLLPFFQHLIELQI